MNLTINLPFTAKCNGCPLIEWYLKEHFVDIKLGVCPKYNLILGQTADGVLEENRPVICITENGL